MSSSADPAVVHPSPLTRVPSSALVLGAIGSVQLGAAIASTLFDRVGPGGAVLLRLAAATVLLVLAWRPRIAGRDRHELVLVCLFGVTLAAMNLAFYSAIDRVPLGIGVTVEFVGPLGVAVFGSRRARDLVWALLAAAGIAALLPGTSGADATGLLFALLAGAFWAGYILLSARVGRTFHSGSGLALAMIVATVVAAPFGIAQGGTALLSGSALAVGAAVGLLSSALPYSLEMEALRRIAPGLFGVLMSLEPAVAALAGFVVLGQSLRLRELAGIALVICASLGATLSRPAGGPARGEVEP